MSARDAYQLQKKRINSELLKPIKETKGERESSAMKTRQGSRDSNRKNYLAMGDDPYAYTQRVSNQDLTQEQQQQPPNTNTLEQ